MILCIVAAGFSPHIGVPQSYIFMRHRVHPRRMGDCSENSSRSRQPSGSESVSVSESEMPILEGRYRFRRRPQQTLAEA